ncbi:MAG TPA: PEP-CTERM sorting domain-containing protein [Gemmataceae bacterium]|nr:PEP-CTERM sorting domain-containing protein [Gemmataceae bacterium]
MKQIVYGWLALGLFAGAVGQGRTDYAFSTIDYPGALLTFAEGINASGQVVGVYLGQDSRDHGFLFSGGTYRSFDVPGAFGLTDAKAINNAGQIVGRYDVSFTAINGFLRNGDAYTTLAVPGAMYTEAHGINDAAQICGFAATNFSSPNHGFLFSNGIYTSFDVPNSAATRALGINNAGQIVGEYFDPVTTKGHGFLRNGDNYVTLDFPGSALTAATAINNSDRVVGVMDANKAFVFEGGGFSTLDVPGASYTDADGINDSNQIVGTYIDGSGTHGYLATPLTAPVPEPSSGMLLALGVACLLGCTWRRRRASATA